MKKGKQATTKTITDTLLAYADCRGLPGRNLAYKARAGMCGAAWVELMSQAMRGYNNFDREVALRVVAMCPADAIFYPAREGSVCVYIKCAAETFNYTRVKECLADEHSYENGIHRLWWD